MGRTVRAERCEQRIEYSPLPSQKRFHLSKARFKGFSGSVGSGKSQALCQEAVRLAYINVGRVGLVGAPTYPMLRDATLTSLLEILNYNEIPYELNKAEYSLIFRDTGSKMILRSLDEFERLRGTNLAWFGVDELTYTQEEAWLRLEARLRDPKAKRLCGFAVWTPKGFDWVYRRFMATTIKGYDVVFASPMENRYLLDSVPDFYDRLKASYDDEFYRQEVLGEYLNLQAGKVYSEFDRTAHLTDLRVDARFPLYWALDFNVTPMCSVVAQIVDDEVRVLDEIVLNRAQTTDACKAFCKRYPNHAAGLRVYGDASGSSQRTTGNSDFGLVQEYMQKTHYVNVQYLIARKNPTVRDRITLMNSRLRNALGEIKLRVDGKCTELIKDLEEVCYKPNSNEVDKDRDPRRTHLSDALGYLVYQECLPRSAVGERPMRLL